MPSPFVAVHAALPTKTHHAAQPQKKCRGILRDLLRYNLQSMRASLLKEDLQQLWDNGTPTWAGKFLEQWCTQVMGSRIEPLKKFARTLRTHREFLHNYFRGRKAFSSVVIW